MSRKHFKPTDIFTSRLKMHPESTFFIYDGEVFINNKKNLQITQHRSGDTPLRMGLASDKTDAEILSSHTYKNIVSGSVSLYELNINRPKGSFAKPFIIQDGFQYDFRGNLTSFQGSTIAPLTSSGGQYSGNAKYPLSASITRMYIDPSLEPQLTSSQLGNIRLNRRSYALYNVGRKKYTRLSKRFLWNNHTTASAINIIDIPSIFYGSTIKKGSVRLTYNITGSKISSVVDENENGELICNFGLLSGSVVGLVYYDEGIIAFPETEPITDISTGMPHFTSSYFAGTTTISDGVTIAYKGVGNGFQNHSWIYFGAGANDGIQHHNTLKNASFEINFQGTTYKNSMTLFCHAEKGEMNFSNNLSYLDSTGSFNINVSEYSYSEVDIPIKNVVSSSYKKHKEDFKKTTYISKVGIYDENNNLIMVADLARPYRKEEEKDITFKLKYDLI